MIRFPGGRGEVFDPIHPDPGALNPNYYAGLVCEYFDQEAQAWIKPKGKANEPLDTCIYALWCTLSPAVKIDAMRESQWVALESKYQPAAPDLFNTSSNPRENNDPAALISQAVVPRETSTSKPKPVSPFGSSEWGSRR